MTILKKRHATAPWRHTIPVATVAALLCACGASVSQSVRWTRAPADPNEYRQSKDGITVELHDVDPSNLQTLSPTLIAAAQACTAQGLATDVDGKPRMTTVPVPGPGQVWVQAALTNTTDHVVRLNGVVVKLFDPAGNEVDALRKEELPGLNTLRTFECPGTYGTAVMQQLQFVKLIDQNVEILPNTTASGFIVFRPQTVEIPGIWKLAIYEVPVLTDDAGKVTKTTRFELRTSVRKYIDTYKQDSPFSESVLVKSREETN